MDESKVEQCPVVFLGLCRRAAQRGYAWDFLGLSRVVYSVIFPTKLGGLFLVFGFREGAFERFAGTSARFTLTDSAEPENKAWADFRFELAGEMATAPKELAHSPILEGGSPSSPSMSAIHMPRSTAEDAEPTGLHLAAFPIPPLFVSSPTRIEVELVVGGHTWRLDDLFCEFAQPPVLTLEERRGIASQPDAKRAVIMHIGCGECGEEIQLCALLDPEDTPPPDAVLADAAPDRWHCGCGRHDVDMRFAKAGLHDLLRRQELLPGMDPITGFRPLYEANRADALINEYELLIRSFPPEEDVQEFLEANPIFWSFLAPLRILHKPSILTRKKADFGILTRTHELIFVEIEKPSTKLINKDGSISAQILKGVNQIRDWEGVVQKHRTALLEELDLADINVQRIRYVVVGGLTRGANAAGLSKLRHGPAPATDFYCFDELAAFLRGTLAGFRGL